MGQTAAKNSPRSNFIVDLPNFGGLPRRWHRPFKISYKNLYTSARENSGERKTTNRSTYLRAKLLRLAARGRKISKATFVLFKVGFDKTYILQSHGKYRVDHFVRLSQFLVNSASPLKLSVSKRYTRKMVIKQGVACLFFSRLQFSYFDFHFITSTNLCQHLEILPWLFYNNEYNRRKFCQNNLE